MTEPKPRSGWPFGVAAALVAMIAGSLCMWWLAVTHPDPPVESHPLGSAASPPRAAG